MSRPPDPRKAHRRGATPFGDDTGYDIHNAAGRIVHGKRWPAPSDIAGITRYVRQRAATGRCVVCGQPTDAPGVTCKATACLSCWVPGHDEPFTVAVEKLEY